MTLKEQVTSLELSKRLKELGVKQESLFYWVKVRNGFSLFYRYEDVFMRDSSDPEEYSAFTVAELGNILPVDYCMSWKIPGLVWVCAENVYDYSLRFYSETEANARAKMLIHLIEKNLIKLEDKK